MKSGKVFFTTALFLLLFVSTALAQNKTAVILNGLDVVPAVRTPATGSGEVWVQSDTLYVQLEFKDLMSPYFNSKIHYGEEGKTGNPIYSLKPNLSEDRRSATYDPSQNKFALSDAMKQAFKDGNLYITIGSEKNRKGEIRGQINPF